MVGVEMYVHWATKNDFAGQVEQGFQIGISVDGTLVMTVPVSAMAAQEVVRKLSQPLTFTGTGPHTVALIVDVNNVVTESKEDDNTYSFIGVFAEATPTPSPTPTRSVPRRRRRASPFPQAYRVRCKDTRHPSTCREATRRVRPMSSDAFAAVSTAPRATRAEASTHR